MDEKQIWRMAIHQKSKDLLKKLLEGDDVELKRLLKQVRDRELTTQLALLVDHLSVLIANPFR